MEGEAGAFGAVGGLELAHERCRVDADAHAREFDGALEWGVPDEYVAVEFPVVVVGGAAVVFCAVGERFADLCDEDGAFFASDGVFALFRCECGVAVEEFLRCDEGDFVGEFGFDFGEAVTEEPFDGFDRRPDALDDGV